MKVAVYCRISRDHEGRELGVERQREFCAELARRLGYVVAEDDVFIENDRGASTLSRKPRPRFEQMMDAAKQGVYAAILAYSSSRLTRRPRELETSILPVAEQHGTRFHFVKGGDHDLQSARGRRRAREDAARDAEEAEEISERLKDEIPQRARQGRYHGGPRAFGFGVEVGKDPLTGKPVIDNTKVREDEAGIVREWYQAILTGGTISGVRKAMAKRGVLTPAGRPWHDSSIRVVLLNSRNGGLRILHGVEYPAPNPPIVAPETWRAVQQILLDPGRRTNADRTARRWLGAGLYLCQRCDRRVRTSYDGTPTRSWRVYVCGTRDGGCGRSWKGEPIDEWVTALVSEIVSRPDAADLLAGPESEADVEGLRAEATAIRARRKQRAADNILGRLSDDEWLAAREAADARLAEIDQELTAAGRSGPLAPIVLAPDPAAAWLAVEDVVQRQAVVRSLMTVRLGAPIRGRARWDARKFIEVEPP